MNTNTNVNFLLVLTRLRLMSKTAQTFVNDLFVRVTKLELNIFFSLFLAKYIDINSDEFLAVILNIKEIQRLNYTEQ